MIVLQKTEIRNYWNGEKRKKWNLKVKSSKNKSNFNQKVNNQND